MFVRVVRMRGDVSRESDIQQYVDHELIPSLKQNPSFRHYYAAVDRETGDAISIILFDSREDAQLPADQQQTMASRLAQLGIEIQDRRVYEVTVDA